MGRKMERERKSEGRGGPRVFADGGRVSPDTDPPINASCTIENIPVNQCSTQNLGRGPAKNLLLYPSARRLWML